MLQRWGLSQSRLQETISQSRDNLKRMVQNQGKMLKISTTNDTRCCILGLRPLEVDECSKLKTQSRMAEYDTSMDDLNEQNL
jgi:hypothetical protein